MATITIQKVNEFLRYAGGYSKGDTKLSYALKKVLKVIEKDILPMHQENLEDLRIDLCSTDEKGNVIYDEKGHYVFTKENLRELNRKAKELMFKPYAFTPFIITELPALTEEEKEAFDGIVLKAAEVKNHSLNGVSTSDISAN